MQLLRIRRAGPYGEVTGGADTERREDQAPGGSMAQYSFAQDAADYSVQGVRGYDLGTGCNANGKKGNRRER